MGMAEWKKWVERLEAETFTLYLAYRNPLTPLHAKLFVALVVGLAFSPIDIIPDFIPVLGYLDDLTVGVPLALRMIPKDIIAESRQEAREMAERGEKPVSRAAALAIIAAARIIRV